MKSLKKPIDDSHRRTSNQIKSGYSPKFRLSALATKSEQEYDLPTDGPLNILSALSDM